MDFIYLCGFILIPLVKITMLLVPQACSGYLELQYKWNNTGFFDRSLHNASREIFFCCRKLILRSIWKLLHEVELLILSVIFPWCYSLEFITFTENSFFNLAWRGFKPTLPNTSDIIAKLDLRGGSRYIFHVFSILAWENLKGVVREDRSTTRLRLTYLLTLRHPN